MIGARPDKALLRRIQALAKKENRKVGPMLCEIARRYFASGLDNNYNNNSKQSEVANK